MSLANVCDGAGWSPVTNPNRLGPANQEVQEPVTEGGVQTRCKKFVGELVGDDRVESGAVVHKEHPDVGVFLFQVGEGIMEV